jgi:Tol biopolymer transport system component
VAGRFLFGFIPLFIPLNVSSANLPPIYLPFVSQAPSNLLVFTIDGKLYITSYDKRLFKKLELPQAAAYGPKWLPDSSRISFFYGQGSTSGLYTIRPDGTDLQRVTPIMGGQEHAWAPDGSHLAFIAGDTVTVTKPDGSAPIVIAQGRSQYNIRWSPPIGIDEVRGNI